MGCEDLCSAGVTVQTLPAHLVQLSLVLGQQWVQEVQLSGWEERRWVAKEVTAVPHWQQCLQLSKETPTAHPGLSVLPWEERGSDALAPNH